MPGKSAVVKNAAAIVFWLLIWEAASVLIDNPFVLVSPRVVFAALVRMAITAEFWQSIGFSIRRIFAGFLCALSLGVILAALSARFKLFQIFVLPAFNVIKSVPVASFTLLALMWLSAANLSTFISFVTVLPIVYFNTVKGIESTSPALLEMAYIFQVSAWKKIRHIYFQAALPYTLSAAGTGLGFAWKSGIAAELIGFSRGSIGASLGTARSFLLTAELFAWTITIVLLSYIMEKAFFLLLKGTSKWA